MAIARNLKTIRRFSPLLSFLPKQYVSYLLRKMQNEKPHPFGHQIRINSFFPPYPSKAFNRFVKAILERQRVPFSTYLAITDACPFHCPHCSYAGRPRKSMDHAQLMSMIQQIKDIGTCTLGITGGEPLLREDLPELVAAAGPQMATVMFTTGWGLTATRAKELHDAKIACVTIGLENTDPAIHDKVRGKDGSFAAARKAVELLHEAGVYTALSTVGFREKMNSGELERIYQTAKEWGCHEMRILPPVATGALNDASAMLTAEEMQRLADFHIEHNKLPDGPSIACFAWLESREMFGCGAGYHHLYIDAAGEVCPCDLTPLTFGNALQEGLAPIWKRMGERFSGPLCSCLMGRLRRAGKFPENPTTFPLPREISEAMVPPRDPAEPLPSAYTWMTEAQQQEL